MTHRIAIAVAALAIAGATSIAAYAQKGADIDWSTTATSYRGQDGTQIGLTCPALGEASFRPVWGTDLYTDDSSICTAAVHAGAITAAGGPVTIEILPGQPSYTGSERNGVTTSNWGSYIGSFRVVLADSGK